MSTSLLFLSHLIVVLDNSVLLYFGKGCACLRKVEPTVSRQEIPGIPNNEEGGREGYPNYGRCHGERVKITTSKDRKDTPFCKEKNEGTLTSTSSGTEVGTM